MAPPIKTEAELAKEAVEYQRKVDMMNALGMPLTPGSPPPYSSGGYGVTAGQPGVTLAPTQSAIDVADIERRTMPQYTPGELDRMSELAASQAIEKDLGPPAASDPTADAAKALAAKLSGRNADPLGPAPVDPMAARLEAMKKAYGPERVVMGKDVTTGEEYSGTRESAYQNKPGLVLDPQTKDNIKAAYLLQEQGVNKRAEAEWKGAEAERLKREQIQAEQDKRFLEAEAAQADKIKEASLYDSLRTEPIRKKIANWELETDRPFQGVGGWIRRIALSISAGVVGAARSEQGKGGPNPVTQMINRMIDRDIAVQKANLANLKDQRDYSDSVYGRLMEESKSPMEGYKQYSIYMKDKMINTLEANKALTRSDVSLANADTTIADLRKSQQKDLVDLMKLEKNEEVFSKGQSMTDKEKTITKRKPVKVGGIPKSALKSLEKGHGTYKIPVSFVKDHSVRVGIEDKIIEAEKAFAELVKKKKNYLGTKDIPFFDTEAKRLWEVYMRPIGRQVGQASQKGSMSDHDAVVVDGVLARRTAGLDESIKRLQIVKGQVQNSISTGLDNMREAGYNTYGLERGRYDKQIMRRLLDKKKKGK